MNLIPEPADVLNRECDCTLTDMPLLRRRMDSIACRNEPRLIADSHPHLFSDAPVFLRAMHAERMQHIVAAVHRIVKLPKYRAAVLPMAPAIAQHEPLAQGVFLGFDFHASSVGPKLIEINTNAGGALINVALRAAQRACCDGVEKLLFGQADTNKLEQRIVGMFMNEWRLARADRPLRSIAIIDEAPTTQFLHPEFLLFKALFESMGIDAYIADSADLEVVGEKVMIGRRPIDLIYNRLTDFYFEKPRHRVMREILDRNLTVVTPHPHAHALYSNKQNLSILSDAAALRQAGASPDDIEALTRGIPTTRAVEGSGERWWNERKQWFFKPLHGFGSRGTYRGDKITRRAFADVMNGRYVAQELTPPGERLRTVAGARQMFKVDIRCYAYGSEIQLMAARLYQGQTTNFRTAGGGFAPVHVVAALK
jgi:hypothetical protein